MSKVKLIGISGGGLNIVNFLESNFSQNYEQKNIEDLNAILENGEKVYIFCTLAGTTSEKNLLKIKDSFKNYCEKINFVLTTPFIFEGEARVQKSKELIKFLQKDFQNISIYSNDSLSKLENISTKEAFNHLSLQIHNDIVSNS